LFEKTPSVTSNKMPENLCLGTYYGTKERHGCLLGLLVNKNIIIT
jgi:hypothetical protein